MNTINTARREANCYTKAQSMTQDGYKWNTLANKMYRIFKPENTAQDKADYIVDLMLTHCTCPDFEKHNDSCKHTLWIGLELEKQGDDDAAMMEAQCMEFDAERARLQTGLIDALLPAPYDVVETEEPVLTVAVVLEALQCRIVQDLERAEAVHAKKDIQCFAVRNDRVKRVNDLLGALSVIGSYWSKELAGILELTPADKVTL